MKILGVVYTYDKNLYKEKNFELVVDKMNDTLALWRWRNLTLSGRIAIFKTMALSKIVYISLLSCTPSSIIDKVVEIQNEFLWDSKKPKMKHNSLINDYAQGGLKKVDIRKKIWALRLSWIKRLYSGAYHPWKIIPKFLLEKRYPLGPFFPNTILVAPKHLPHFYISTLSRWSNILQERTVPSTIQNQIMFNNHYIRIGGKTVRKWSSETLFAGDFFEDNGTFKSWINFKNEKDLTDNDQFRWMQIKHAIPRKWITLIQNDIDSFQKSNGLFREQCLLLGARNLPIEKFTSQNFYHILLQNVREKPTAQMHIEKNLSDSGIEWPKIWPKIYMNVRHFTLDGYSRDFYFKLVNNILQLNKNLSRAGFVNTSLCSYCKMDDETPLHLFCNCTYTSTLWREMQMFFSRDFILPDLTPWSARLGLPLDCEDVMKHLHLIFMITIYKNRAVGSCSFNYLKNKILYVRKIELNLKFNSANQRRISKNKWSKIMLSWT